jgi:hypothetical protein
VIEFRAFLAMIEPDPKTTLREFQEYSAISYESPGKIAARVGVSQSTIWAWLAAKQVRYARLCSFCRKARGKIRSASKNQFHGVCPKCGASGPKRKSHQEALRAWNGRE